MALLEAKSITPGETALAQLVLGGPVQAVHGDRFVLRNAGNITTVAGGRVIDPFSPKRGRAKPERLALVRQLAELDLVDGAIAELTATRNGFDLHLYSVGRGISPDAQAELADGLPAVTIGDSLIDQDRWTSLKTEITEFLSRYHQEHPNLLTSVNRRAFQARHLKPSSTVWSATAILVVPDQPSRSPDISQDWPQLIRSSGRHVRSCLLRLASELHACGNWQKNST